LRVAIQLYSLRQDCAKDFFGTLKSVADLGYDGVEFAGFYGKTPQEVREELDKLGLGVAGSHTGFNATILWAYRKTVDFNKAIGNKNIIIPGVPGELRQGKDDWYQFASFLNELSAKLSKEGLRVGYHNHVDEFALLDGERPWDILGKNTKDVILQLDVGHAVRALGSAEEATGLIDKYPGRTLTIHVKDYSKTKGYNVIPGEGDVDWHKLFSACKRNGTEWLIIEQEEYPYQPPLETAKKALENVRQILKTV